MEVTRMFNEEDHPRGTGAKGGQFVAKDEGQSKPAPKPPSRPKSQPKPQPKPAPKPEPKVETKPKPTAKTEPKPEPKRGPMKRGGDNDPAQVKELQNLLKALGLSNHSANGNFDEATENAVKQAQKRLGLKPTGRASAALVRKMMAAHALSPCIKRSGDLDCSDVVRAEFPNLSAALDSGQLDEEETSVDVYRSEILRYERAWPLEDITIQRSGDGRTVEAYAAIWDTPAEVRDQHGHYMEVISRTAFDKTIQERGDRPIPVFYNHGMTAAGSPSDVYSVPIGRSLEIRAESRGLWTLSRYNDGPDADRVLEAIRNGAITAQSFRGRVYKSSPTQIKRSRPGEPLPQIVRTELGLAEYGPTASAVYEGAAILALRSQQQALATLLAKGYDLDQLFELARTSTTPEEEPETTEATSEPEAGTDEPLTFEHSSRQQSAIARGIKTWRIHRQTKGVDR